MLHEFIARKVVVSVGIFAPIAYEFFNGLTVEY